MYERAKYLPVGDKGMVIEFGNAISPEINYKVRSFAIAISNASIPGLKEYIPTYRSIFLVYDPLVWKFEHFVNRLQELENSLNSLQLPQPNIYHIPVAYGGQFGPDLDSVCQYTGLSINDFVSIHTSTNYLIYMLGFTPGFPYLGGMDKRIASPRLDTPRIKVIVGSVGIAGTQTGVYPVESPGGWQIIGRTPVKLFEPLNKKPVLLNAGDYVCFFAITIEDYQQITSAVERGEYKVMVSKYDGEGI